MGDYLLKVGIGTDVVVNNKLMNLLIIGTCIEDNENILFDYVGIPSQEGYKGTLYYFNHREIVDIANYRG